MANIVIRSECCKACMYCVKFCPKHVLKQGSAVNAKGYQYVEAAALENCIGCSLCAVMCPDAAIEVYR